MDRTLALFLPLQKLFPAAETTDQRDSRRLFVEEHRGALEGRRGFVIGNGPSLLAEDLDRLKGEVSFGANLISMIFRQTRWRPHFISVTDPLVWSKVKLEQAPESIPWLVDSSFNSRQSVRKILAFRRFARLSPDYYTTRVAHQAFSRDVTRGFFGGNSVTFFNIQLAFALGVNPVYLLGVDHHFRNNPSRFFSKPVRIDDPVDHFHRDYRARGEVVNSAPVRAIEHAIRSLEQVKKETGFQVVDLTRGGRLPHIEKMSFDDVVPIGPRHG